LTSFAAADWPSFRGNAQRTGSDGKAGPTAPKVLWAYMSKDHFIAAPVPSDGRLFIPGLSLSDSLYCLSTDAKIEKRELWTKTTPILKLPVVSAPAVTDGRIVFGDGMHQHNGGFLHCLKADTGALIWELSEPGNLVHLEGAPTIDGKRVYIGGGSAGVLCVDFDHVTMDGKDYDVSKPADAQTIENVRKTAWQKMQTVFEEEKKKDPDLAVPPSEDKLPKPAPKLLWQQGKDKWHVDAAVTVAGGSVFAASAFLDAEKEGDRAIFCLDAKTGDTRWRKPLPINPWGGVSVADDLAVVCCSSINYDMKSLKGAKGLVAAFDAKTGEERWSKEVKGGVVSCAAIADGAVYCTATDGKVRSFDLKTGDLRWASVGMGAFFAPPAVAGGVVYVGDLAGVVHALDASDGKEQWRLDLGTDPAIKAPGMIYAGPLVHNGRLYVASCNIEGANAAKPTAVVCIGEK
jgi:outer membrane protein assembly factor BamB